jgi:hypothetical protein
MLAVSAFVAGMALADVSFSVQMDGTFGLYTADKTITDTNDIATGSSIGDGPDGITTDDSGDFSQITGSNELNFNFGGSSGNVSWAARYRVDDVEGTPNKELETHRERLYWKINDQMELQFHSRSFGGPSMAVGDVSGVIGEFSFGDATAYIGWENKTLLNFMFNAGAANVGFAISDECVVNCGFYVGATDVNATKDAQSYILHANGAAGAIKWGVQLVSSTALAPITKDTGTTRADDDKEVSSTGVEIGVKWSGPATVGFTYSTLDIGCEVDAVANPGVSCSQSLNLIKVGVLAQGAAFAVTTNTFEAEFSQGGVSLTYKEETTNIDASYAIEVAPGVVVGPELRIENKTITDPDSPSNEVKTETSKQLIGIAYSGSF